MKNQIDVNEMGWMRALLGAVIGTMIFYNEGWPLYFIIRILNLPHGLNSILLYLMIGILVGIISGSTIWGIISSIIIIPVIATLFFNTSGQGSIIEYIFQFFQRIPLDRIFYLGLGGLIGGAISGSFTGDDYVILRVKK